MYRGLSVSLVLPCYNEEEGLRKMLPCVPALFDEVVIVDNCSTDGGAALAAAAGARVVREERKGYGAAYKAGFAAARCDVIITMDADDTYPLHAVEEMLCALVDGNLDFITVRRMHTNWERTFELIIKFFGKKILDFLTSILILKMINDTQSGMWVFKRNILEKFHLTSPGMCFSEEIKMEAFVRPDVRAAEIPVLYEYRKRLGKRKLNIVKDGFCNLIFIFTKRIQLFRDVRSR